MNNSSKINLIVDKGPVQIGIAGPDYDIGQPDYNGQGLPQELYDENRTRHKAATTAVPIQMQGHPHNFYRDRNDIKCYSCSAVWPELGPAITLDIPSGYPLQNPKR